MRTSVFLSVLLLAGSVFALAADEKEKKPATIASVLNGNLSNEEEEFVPAADAHGLETPGATVRMRGSGSAGIHPPGRVRPARGEG